jgi:NitT/TauT family transport system substrate-binding protein
MRNFLFALIGIITINTACAEKLVIATSNRGNPDTTFSEFALKNGFLDKCEIDIQHFWSASGAEAIQAVIAGSADISLSMPYGSGLGMYAKGAPIKTIGSSFIGQDTFWYVKNDSPFKEMKDLEGKRVAFGTNGSYGDIITRNLQKNSGVNFERVATGYTMVANYASVMTGQIEAANAAYPTLLDKVASKEIRIIATGKQFVPERDEISSRIVIAHNNSIANKRKQIECWAAGVDKSIDYFYSDDKAVIKYAELVGFSVESVTLAKSLIDRKQFNIYSLSGEEQAIKDGVETKTLTTPLSEEQIKSFYIKLSR